METNIESYINNLINMYPEENIENDEDIILDETALITKDIIETISEESTILDNAINNITVETKINVSINVSLIDTLKEKFKNFIQMIWQKIKDFFYSVFHFFESKILQINNKYLKDNIDKINAYFSNNKDELTCKMHKYIISNPIENFVVDSNVLKDAIPVLCNTIDNLINKLYSDISNFDSVRYAMGFDKEDSTIKVLKQRILEEIAPKNYNIDLVSTPNIAKLLKIKYFGDEYTEIIEQPIKSVITNSSIFNNIISDEVYFSFKEMYKVSKITITSCQKDIEKFNKSVQSDKLSYEFIKMHMSSYRQLLTMVLYTIIAYWNMYHTIRTDVISAANAIINN